MIYLPDVFKEKMKGLLGEEYGSFIESYERDRVQGLRLNPLKISPEEFLKISPFSLEKIPWTGEGYYYRQEDRPGKHPFHEAGLYYIQEPSAMAVTEVLDPRPGEKILDLCAAPGGKTTHIAGRMKGRGFLLSNEIHLARARILSQNVERFGIGNAVVSNEDSGSLAKRFPEFFDGIAVDAPCSGEGMFRKDETAGTEWSLRHVEECAARQEEILSNAARMLKPGGRLVYSTCTFSPEENEQTVENFLLSHPDFSVQEAEKKPEFSPGKPEWSRTGLDDLKKTFRIWPHKTEGEGHYLAVLKKAESCLKEKKLPSPVYMRDKSVQKELEIFLNELLKEPEQLLCRKEYILFGEQLYLIPPEMPDFKGMKILRPGLHLGTVKKNRFEVRQWAELPADGPEIVKYLKGETILKELALASCLDKKGWILVTVNGFSAGFAKLTGDILKNHYPKGLRWM